MLQRAVCAGPGRDVSREDDGQADAPPGQRGIVARDNGSASRWCAALRWRVRAGVQAACRAVGERLTGACAAEGGHVLVLRRALGVALGGQRAAAAQWAPWQWQRNWAGSRCVDHEQGVVQSS
jgi:hypothetical protein